MHPIRKTNALLVSDSLFKFAPPQVHEQLTQAHDLDNLEIIPHPGRTIQELIGPKGAIHELLKTRKIDLLFLCAGANNYNRSSEVSAARRGEKVIDEVKSTLHFFLV